MLVIPALEPESRIKKSPDSSGLFIAQNKLR
jgi:hypothetical protein